MILHITKNKLLSHFFQLYINQNIFNKWILNLILSKFPLDALSSSNYPISYAFFYPVGPVPGWQVLLCVCTCIWGQIP